MALELRLLEFRLCWGSFYPAAGHESRLKQTTRARRQSHRPAHGIGRHVQGDLLTYQKSSAVISSGCSDGYSVFAHLNDGIKTHRDEWVRGRFTYIRPAVKPWGRRAYGDPLVPRDWAKGKWAGKVFGVSKCIEHQPVYPRYIAVFRKERAE
jgi:hypothetical protein